jgi:RHS repeat-associated protein
VVRQNAISKVWFLAILFWFLFCPSISAEELIDSRTGKLFLAETDYSLKAGRVSLEMVRTLSPEAPDNKGLLGSFWRLNWDRRLSHKDKEIFIDEAEGLKVFNRDPNGKEFKNGSGERVILETDNRARWLKRNGAVEYFDREGRLEKIEYPNRQQVRLHYTSSGLLAKIEGPYGHFIDLKCNPDRLLATAETSLGDKIEYVYEGRNLTSVRLNNKEPIKYVYDNRHLVGTENPAAGPLRLAYDDQGRITLRRWADGTEERHEYDDALRRHRILHPDQGITVIQWEPEKGREEVTNPLGHKQVNEFDPAGRLKSITRPDGVQTRFTYDGLGRTASVAGCCGQATLFEYHKDTELPAKIVYPDQTIQSFEYDSQLNLTAIKNGNQSSAIYTYYSDGLLKSEEGVQIPPKQYTYDQRGRPARETDALGGTLSYGYDEKGRQIQQTDALGGITRWAYDHNGFLKSKTDPTGGSTHYDYDRSGRLVREKRPAGATIEYWYDSRGRRTVRLDPQNRTISYSYDSQGRLQTITDPLGGIHRFEYDRLGNLTRETNPLGGVTQRAYDASGRLIRKIDPAGLINEYQYNPLGAVTKIIGPGGEETKYEYDSAGHRRSVIDRRGQKTETERTQQGQPVKISYPDGSVSRFEYDGRGNLVREYDNRGNDSRYDYDALGQITREKLISGYEIQYIYDGLGRLRETRDNLGGQQHWEYDLSGRKVKSWNSSATAAFRYDPEDRLLSETGPLGFTRNFSYTSNGALVQVIDPSGETTQYGHDLLDHLQTLRNADGQTVRYRFNRFNQPLEKVFPGGRTYQYHYDPAGRIIGYTDPKGQNKEFFYNQAGRLAREKTGDGKTIQYRYNAAGDLIEVDDGQFPVRYERDNAGRIRGVSYPVLKKNLRYEYNGEGLLSRFIDGDGQVYQYEYDRRNRNTAIILPGAQRIGLDYDARERLKSISYPNGIRGTWDYDQQNRPLHIAYTLKGGKKLLEWQYAYDGEGNVLSVKDLTGATNRYRYDKSGRLIEATEGREQAQYLYSPGGNRIEKKSGSRTLQYQYNDLQQLIKAGEESFSYDANGNLTEKKGPRGITRYFYDGEDKLVRVGHPDGKQTEFGYAPTGERIWRRSPEGMTYFLNAGLQVSAELDSEMKSRERYFYLPGLDRPLAVTGREGTLFYHGDSLGSIRALSDAQGGLKTLFKFDAFGNLDDPRTPYARLFRFTGRPWEPDLGLFYFRSRYYDPGSGRFLSRDKLDGEPRNPISFHPYLYVQNNPLKYIDPFGTDPVPPTLVLNPSAPPMSPYAPLSNIDLAIPDRIPQFMFNQQHPTLGNIDQHFNLKPNSVLGTYDPGNGVIIYQAGQQNSVRMAGTVAHEIGHAQTRYLAESAQPGSYSTLSVSKNEQISAWQEAHHLVRDRGVSVDNPEVQRAIRYYEAHGGNPSKLTNSLSGFTKPGISGQNIASGVSTGLGTAALVANHQACLAEGKSQTECAKMTILAYGAGMAAGYITAQAAFAGLAALGISAAAATAVLTAGGIALAGYGVYTAGERLANAPEVKALQEMERMQRDLLRSFNDLAAKLGADLSQLEGQRAAAEAACQEIRQMAASVRNAASAVKGKMGEIRSSLAVASGLAAKCQEGVSIKGEIEGLLAKVSGYEDLVLRGGEGALARVNACNSPGEATEAQTLYENCTGLASGMNQYADRAEALNSALRTILSAGELARSMISAAEGSAQFIGSQVSAIQATAATFFTKQDQAKNLEKSVQGQREGFQSQLSRIKGLLPSAPPSERMAEEFANAIQQMSLLEGRMGNLRTLTPCEVDSTELTTARLDSENLYSQAENAIEGIRGDLSACENLTPADETAQSVRVSAKNAQASLGRLAGIPQQVADCLKRLGNKPQDDQRVADLRSGENSDNNGSSGNLPEKNVLNSYQQGQDQQRQQATQQTLGTMGSTRAERTAASQEQQQRDQARVQAQGQATNQAIFTNAQAFTSAQQALQGDRQNGLGNILVSSLMGGLTSGVAIGIDNYLGTIGSAAGQQVITNWGIQPPKPTTGTTPATGSGQTTSGQTATSGSGTASGGSTTVTTPVKPTPAPTSTPTPAPTTTTSTSCRTPGTCSYTQYADKNGCCSICGKKIVTK